MTHRPPTIDPDKLKLYSLLVFTKLDGAVTAAMIHLGDQLGLYRAMRAAGGPVTVDELATATALDARWMQEWVHNQAAAKLVEADTPEGGPERFSLSPEATVVLADPDHPAFGMGMFHRFPQTMRAVEEARDSFRTGVGHDYDSHGPEGAVGIERSFEPWNRTFLVPVVLPALDGVVAKLEAGATVADVGCGAGGALIMMAEAFPASTFHGYDISQYALARAEEKKAEAGVDQRALPRPARRAAARRPLASTW